jgi:hypothetical protein
VTGALWLAALCLLPLCGFPLLSHPAFRAFSLPSRVALSAAAGAVMLSAAMTGAVLAAVRWNETALAATAVALATGLRLLLGKESATPKPAEPLRAAGGIAHLLSGAAVLCAGLAAWSGSASSPDLVFFWGAKAQQFAAAKTIDVPFLQDAFHRYMHLYYPPLVTNVYAFATMLAGRFAWTAAVSTFPLLLAALAVALPGVVRTSLPRPAAAACAALAVAALAYAGTEADVGGNGEMPLLLFETLAAAILVSPHARAGGPQLLAGVLLAGAATTKVEGLPFAASAAALFLAVGVGRSERGAAAARLLLPPAACLGAWFLFGATRHLFVGYSGEGRLIDRLMDVHPERLSLVVRAIAKALAGCGHGLPWLVPLAVLLAAAFAGRLRRAALVPLGTAAVLAAFFLFTYVHREEDPAQWISWSAARIFMPVAALLVLAGACGATDRAGAAAPQPRRAAPSRS